MRGRIVYRETGRKETRGGSRYWKILEDTGKLVFTSICTSIADTGRFW
jgi:hypothetical protein